MRHPEKSRLVSPGALQAQLNFIVLLMADSCSSTLDAINADAVIAVLIRR